MGMKLPCKIICLFCRQEWPASSAMTATLLMLHYAHVCAGTPYVMKGSK